MKGDPVPPIACPLCDKVLMVRRVGEFVETYENTTRGRRRAAVFRHFSWAHPSLGLREKSILADEALDAPVPEVRYA